MKKLVARLDVVRRKVGGLVARRVPGWCAGPSGASAPTVFRGHIDLPVETVLQRGLVTFHGWALVGQHSASKVTIVVNGTRRVRAEPVVRPDVPASLVEPTATSACGWAAPVDLLSEPQGDLRVQVLVEGQAGTSQIVSDRLFALRGDGIAGLITAPADGALLPSSLLAVRGWACAADRVARVEVYVDGVSVGPARLGLPTPATSEFDIARLGLAAGWEARSVVPPGPPGASRAVSAVVSDLRGQEMRLDGITVVMQPPALSEPEVALAGTLQERTRVGLARPTLVSSSIGRDLLVFTHSLSIGGGELYLQDLLRGIAPSLGSCRLIASFGGILAEELEALGIDVSTNPRVVPTDVAAYEGAVRELAGFIRSSGCTVVLLNTIGLWFAADAAQRAGIPTIWAIHESFELADWLDINCGGYAVPPYVPQRMRAAIAAASRLVFESDATRSMYVAGGAPPGAASTVHYGVDVDAIAEYAEGSDRAADRATHGLPLDATVILCMGVFQDRKGQLWLADAFVELLEVHPTAVLVLVGDHPAPYADYVRSLIASKGMAERVRTVPITVDAWVWYLMADVLISASDVESLPRSMLEAMAFGCPVFAASVHGIPELIVDGETGWLMAPRDTRALIAGLHRVLSLSPHVRHAVGNAGRKLVEKSYRADGYVGRYLDMIDELEAQSGVEPIG